MHWAQGVRHPVSNGFKIRNLISASSIGKHIGIRYTYIVISLANVGCYVAEAACQIAHFPSITWELRIEFDAESQTAFQVAA